MIVTFQPYDLLEQLFSSDNHITQWCQWQLCYGAHQSIKGQHASSHLVSWHWFDIFLQFWQWLRVRIARSRNDRIEWTIVTHSNARLCTTRSLVCALQHYSINEQHIVASYGLMVCLNISTARFEQHVRSDDDEMLAWSWRNMCTRRCVDHTVVTCWVCSTCQWHVFGTPTITKPQCLHTSQILTPLYQSCHV